MADSLGTDNSTTPAEGYCEGDTFVLLDLSVLLGTIADEFSETAEKVRYTWALDETVF